MAEIQINGPSCVPGDDKPKHKKPKARPSGLLKFSGVVPLNNAGSPPVVSYLADPGRNVAIIAGAPNGYPLAVEIRLENLAVNVQNYTVIAGGSIVIELLKNGSPVSDFTITYGSGASGIKVVKAHATFKIGDTLDLQVTVSGVTDVYGVRLAATIGIED